MATNNFNAANLESATAQNNNLRLLFVDSNGQKQSINLSPQAKNNLLMSLMTRPTSPNPDAALACNGVRWAVIDKSTPCLEFSFAQNLAIPIIFPPEAIGLLKEQIALLEKRLSEVQGEKH
jgi:hypothetical protein